MAKIEIILRFCERSLDGEIRMIERLYIKDLLSFSEVCLNPSANFNIFSGISGSGKSVLIEGILSLFGLKECNASVIEATFAESKSIPLPEDFLADCAIVLKIIKKDKTKYFLNSQSISKKRLKEIFAPFVRYITAHSVNELESQNLLLILDNLVEQKDYRHLLSAFRAEFVALNQKRDELAKLEAEEAHIAELKEFVAYEISQIERVNPKIGEYEELLELKKSLSKKDKILEKINAAKPAIEGFSKVISLLDLVEKNKEIYGEILREIEGEINAEAERLEGIDEKDIEGVLNRLEALSQLVRKYGSIDSALNALGAKKADLERYNNLSFNKNVLQKEVANLADSALKKARQISEIRQNTLPKFCKKLTFFCEKLKLNAPKVTILDKEICKDGVDKVEIFLNDSAIATLSSGEFNRLKLAIMCVDIDFTKQCGILILDEIDANLSGSESEGVAEILGTLSKKYQIFAISHQSHMPCFASNHYLISKDNALSSATLLDKNGRINEIARMISGANITQKALNFAKEKLAHLK
ncbi:AAA family ATPase [Helicobacter sp. 23-1045]